MSATQDERIVLNVGCGPRDAAGLPGLFNDWRKIRVDVDESVQPDIIADLTDLSPIPTGSVHAVWAAHCVEHLYIHQVPVALAEFRRVLRPDGFMCVIVPDLQTVAKFLVADRSHEPLYRSPAGPVTAHDIIFGFSPEIASGRTAMAHRCGFTPTSLQRCFLGIPLGEIVLRRRAAQLELAAVARATPAQDDADRAALMSALEL